MFFSSCTQTNIFLCNIQQSKYADFVTTLQSHVYAYICEDDDGYLPTVLCINGIATLIHLNALARVRDVAHGLPCVCHAFGDIGYGPWAPSNIIDNAVLPLCAVQGYTPQVYRVDQGWDHVCSSPGGWSYDRAGLAGRGSCDYSCPPPCDWNGRNGGRDGGHSSPRDRSIRPDHPRCGFLPNVQCDACNRVGHVATNCDMLAMALFLDKYVKQSLSDEDKRKVESNWLHMYKEKLGQPQRPPSQVMKVYCADLDILLDLLDCAMDWDCWPVDESGDFLANSHGLESGLS
jgi:hypothetical protein